MLVRHMFEQRYCFRNDNMITLQIYTKRYYKNIGEWTTTELYPQKSLLSCYPLRLRYPEWLFCLWIEDEVTNSCEKANKFCLFISFKDGSIII